MCLYSEEDFSLRPEHNTPEIARADLSQFSLSIRAMKIALDDLHWLDAPPAGTVQTAELLLDRIGANGGMEQRLARFPLPPRLSRILVEALDRGVGEDGCMAAAILGLGARSEKNDLLAAMDLPQDYRLRQHTEQLLRMARPPKQTHHDDEALLIACWLAFLTVWPAGERVIRCFYRQVSRPRWPANRHPMNSCSPSMRRIARRIPCPSFA
jgi:ATP-dependent helicase HrpB